MQNCDISKVVKMEIVQFWTKLSFYNIISIIFYGTYPVLNQQFLSPYKYFPF